MSEQTPEPTNEIWLRMRAAPGPFLDLRAEEVGPERNLGTLAYLLSLMLFPDDEDKRLRIAAAEAAAILGTVPDSVFAGIGGRTIARMLRQAPHLLGGLDVEEQRRCNIGFAIGGSVLELLVADKTASFYKYLEDYEKASDESVQQKKDSRPIERLAKNWWPHFRPVSHLWAAHRSIWRPGYPSFPCTVKDLPDFLSAAEYIRFRAQQRHLARQGRSTLLPVGVAWAVPADVPLPLPRVVIGEPEIWHCDAPSAK